MPSCQACPLGKYASQQTGQRDYYQCPNATSPAIRFSPLYQWKQAVANRLLPAECTQLVVGADACTACPADRQYTHQMGSTSVADCRRCPAGQFFSQTRCMPCRPECSRALNEYETQGCTNDRNRECGYCDSSSCDPILEYVLEEGCSLQTGSRGCGSCSNKPDANSHYILGDSPCSWSCDEGYFSDLFLGDTCQPCTRLNATTCPAGRIFSACSDFLHRDASCEQECSAEETRKPVENSEWVLTTYDEDGNLVAAPPSVLLPNAGCMWRCSDGYRLQSLAEGMLNICVRTGQA